MKFRAVFYSKTSRSWLKTRNKGKLKNGVIRYKATWNASNIKSAKSNVWQKLRICCSIDLKIRSRLNMTNIRATLISLVLWKKNCKILRMLKTWIDTLMILFDVLNQEKGINLQTCYIINSRRNHCMRSRAKAHILFQKIKTSSERTSRP